MLMGLSPTMGVVLDDGTKGVLVVLVASLSVYRHTHTQIDCIVFQRDRFRH
jgi:hypothetical protein